MTTKLIPKKPWEKSIIAVYYLLVAYKKTINAKLKYYLASSPNTPFFFTLAPFLAYFIQLTFTKYPFSYEQNAFFQKSLPGLRKPIQKMTWETFAYTKHSNKLDLELITQVNLLDDSFFLSLNPFWKIKKQQLYQGQFESSNLNWSFIPSRYFYHLLSTSEKQSLVHNFSFEGKKFDDFFLQKKSYGFNSEVRFWKSFKLLSCGPIESSLSTLPLEMVRQPFFFKAQAFKKSHQLVSLKKLNFVQSKVSLNKLKLNVRWQFFFNELDDIPTKLNSVFSHRLTKAESKGTTQNRVLDTNLPTVFSDIVGQEGELSSLKKTDLGPLTVRVPTQPDLPDLKSSNSLNFPPASSFINLINAGPSNIVEVSNLEEKKNKFLLKQFKINVSRLISNAHNLTCTIKGESEIELLTKKDLKKKHWFFEKPNREQNSQLLPTFSTLKFQGTAIKKPCFSFQPLYRLKKISEKKWVKASNLDRNKILGIRDERAFSIKKTAISLERSKRVDRPEKNFYEPETIKSSLLQTNLKPSNFPPEISPLPDSSLIEKNLTESFDYSRIELLTEIFNEQSKKEQPSFVFKRNFHYNLGFGFSQLGKLIKLNALHQNLDFKVEKDLKRNDVAQPFNFFKFVEKTKSSEIFSNKVSLKWKKVIRRNLTNPPPIWLSLLNNRTNNDQFNEESFGSGYSTKARFEINEKNLIENRQPLSLTKPGIVPSGHLNHFVEIRSLEKTLLNSFKFNKVTTTRVVEKPELILELFKKQNSRRLVKFFQHSSKNSELTNKSQTSKINTARILQNSNSFAQRKVSGYLYPDSLREIIALNTRQLKGKNPSFSDEVAFFDKKSSPFFHNLDLFGVEKNVNRIQSSLGKEQVELPIAFSFKNFFNFSLKRNNSLKKGNNWGLSIQVYQPLTSNSDFNPTFSPGIQNSNKTYRELVKLFQNKENSQIKIHFDNPSTTKKNYFFGKPTKSPIFGVTLKDYLLKYNNPNSHVDKKLLIFPYSDPVNFLFRLKSNLENKTHLKSADFQSNPLSKEFSHWSKKDSLTEITKVTSFSKVGVNFSHSRKAPLSFLAELKKKPNFKPCLKKVGENKFLSVFKSPLDQIYKSFFPEQKTFPKPKNFSRLQKNSTVKIQAKSAPLKILDKYAKAGHQNQPTFYKTHSNYTKSSFLQSSVESFSKPLIKTPFITDLYESANFKSWAILSQLGFSLMVLKGLGVLRNEYSEEIVYYIDQFAASLNEFDKEALKALILKDNFRVIKRTEKKFDDLVGGDFLLTEFGQVILLLRNSRKDFLKIAVTKPRFLSINEQKNIKLTKLNFFAHEFTEPLIKTIKPFFNGKEPVSQIQSFVSNPNLELGTLIQKTILLVGPPGTGKTLFVQALAGEAGVPIILESGKMLTTNMEAPGPEKLTDLFKAAREMSPCILFLDEVDTIGQKRDNIISSFTLNQNQKQIPSTLNLIYLQNGIISDSEVSDSLDFGNYSNHKWDILNPVLKFQISKKTNKNEAEKLNSLKIQITNQEQTNSKNKDQDLAMLTQLLCELDGLTKNQDIIVIGATNRPATLDPALTRPGRFGKIIYLDLPGKQKRFELLKFYSRALLPLQNLDFSPEATVTTRKEIEANRTSAKLKVDENKTFFASFQKSADRTGINFKTKSHELDVDLNWDYFANQTVGLSAAHLEAAINRSSLKVISSYLAKNQKKSVFSPQKKAGFVFPQKFFNISKSISSTEKGDHLKFGNSSNNNKYSFLQRLPKNFKLRLLTQFTNNKNQTFNQLFQISKKKEALNFQKFLFSSVKKSYLMDIKKRLSSPKELFSFVQRQGSKTNSNIDYPFHTFETIEYGIQTISTMNTNVHLNLTLGNKVIKKLLGQITFTDLTLPTVSNQKNKGNASLEQKDAGLDLPLVRSFSINSALKLFRKAPVLNELNFSHKFEKLLRREKQQSFRPKEVSTTLEPVDLAYQKKTVIRSFKQQGKKRKSFYQKHRFYLRTLILLGVTKKAKEFIFLPDKKKDRENSKCLFTKTEIKSQILNKYINRIIQNQSLGWLLLNNSTCLMQNPLFNFSIQQSNLKNRNSIYYSFLSLNNWADSSIPFGVQKKRHLLLKWKNFNSISQTALFGDALFINRSAYYLSGKAFIRFATLTETKKEKPIRLWTFTGLTKTRHKQKFKSKQFLTKIQFEKFLLSLIAGKATETLLLANYSNDQKKNNSNIGIEELKEFGFLMSLMSEKHLFYSQRQLTQKQININLVKNKSQNQQKETLLFLSQFATLLEIKTQTATHLPSNFLRDQFYLKWVDKPWWQSKSSTLVSSNNLQYGQWYRLFVSEEKQNFRNIEWIAPDTYFHNQVNNQMLFATKTCNTKYNEEKVENYFINRELVEQYFKFCNLNWNQLQLFESESLTSYFIFESFNKVFTLLEKNRELIDSIVYSLLCHESVRDFEIQNIHQRFLNTNFKSSTETKTENA